MPRPSCATSCASAAAVVVGVHRRRLVRASVAAGTGDAPSARRRRVLQDLAASARPNGYELHATVIRVADEIAAQHGSSRQARPRPGRRWCAGSTFAATAATDIAGPSQNSICRLAWPHDQGSMVEAVNGAAPAEGYGERTSRPRCPARPCAPQGEQLLSPLSEEPTSWSAWCANWSTRARSSDGAPAPGRPRPQALTSSPEAGMLPRIRSRGSSMVRPRCRASCRAPGR